MITKKVDPKMKTATKRERAGHDYASVLRTVPSGTTIFLLSNKLWLLCGKFFSYIVFSTCVNDLFSALLSCYAGGDSTTVCT